ncbi:MAG TPA: amidohydrolase family protein, partial [Chloroflexota bacterium]|nr:amidohydrolase family protein [Chloroflexota bacterium]
NRFIPFGTVNPRDGDVALREMERCVRDLGHRGFKLHPWFTSFLANSPASHEVSRQGERLGVPFIIHSGTPPNSSPLQIAEMARVAPGTTFILAHMGLPDLWKEALSAARRYPNILLETAGTPSLAIRVAVERLGAHRVVYGSDLPFGDKCNVFFQIQKIRDLRLSPEDESLILGGNAHKLLGL